jgi:curved DNA-binding protein CbpA
MKVRHAPRRAGGRGSAFAHVTMSGDLDTDSNAPMATLYETLGVHEHATEDEIKRAYRKAAMRCHPDRNVGHEEAARVQFQEIKEAYAILSDPAQRHIYDSIFEEEMRRFEARRREEEAERARRGEEERAAAQMLYAQRVALAMRYATQGYNRDVVFGVLLGQHCDPQNAAQIADSALALHESRQREEEDSRQRARAKEEPAEPEQQQPQQQQKREEEERAARSAEPEAASAHHAFSNLWFQFLNGLRM